MSTHLRAHALIFLSGLRAPFRRNALSAVWALARSKKIILRPGLGLNRPPWPTRAKAAAQAGQGGQVRAPWGHPENRDRKVTLANDDRRTPKYMAQAPRHRAAQAACTRAARANGGVANLGPPPATGHIVFKVH